MKTASPLGVESFSQRLGTGLFFKDQTESIWGRAGMVEQADQSARVVMWGHVTAIPWFSAEVACVLQRAFGNPKPWGFAGH